MKQTDKIFYIMGIIILAAFATVALLQATDILRLTEFGLPCSFRFITKHPCPGCGGTHAVCSLAKGDLIQSFLYHPFVPYTLLGFFFYVLWNTVAQLQNIYAKRKDSRKLPVWHFRTVHIYIGIALIFIQWGVKLVLTS